MHVIYKITNKKNNKHYIGQSKNPHQRWYRHKAQSRYPKQVIHFAMAKYGLSNFDFAVLEEVENQEEANLKEEFWACEYNSYFPYGYNIAKCGNCKPLTEDIKQKISNTQKGRKVSFCKRAKISRALKGKGLTLEHRKAISEGLKNSEVENKGQFKKGNLPKSGFQKGNKPWNYGKSGYKVPAISEARKGKTKYTKEQVICMKNLKLDGYSYRFIAKKFNTVHTYVKKLINLYGDI